jgi:hypothetical protein
LRKAFFIFLSLLAVSLILFGKYKLATAKITIPLLFLGGLAFAASTPQQTSIKTLEQ